MRGAAFALFSFVALLPKKPLSATRYPFIERHRAYISLSSFLLYLTLPFISSTLLLM